MNHSGRGGHGYGVSDILALFNFESHQARSISIQVFALDKKYQHGVGRDPGPSQTPHVSNMGKYSWGGGGGHGYGVSNILAFFGFDSHQARSILIQPFAI